MTSKAIQGGFFVTFEGGEGTGKTTQIKRLSEDLKAMGFEVLVTWEPGGTALGTKIREMLLDPQTRSMSPRCEALLFAAARAEHVASVIRPALEAGKIVLCDRYWDASKAYQGAGRNLGFRAIDEINSWGTQDCRPHHTFVFDISPEKGLERARARNQGQMDRLEQEAIAFHQNVRGAYLEIANSDPARYTIVDAGLGIEDVSNNIKKVLVKCLA